MERIERVYNISLGDAYLTTRTKATKRAVDILRAFIKRHLKVDEENIKLSNKLNNFVWLRGRKKPPRQIKIKVIKDNSIARAYLHDEKIEEKKVEQKEAKAEEKKVPEEKKETKQPSKTAKKKEEKSGE